MKRPQALVGNGGGTQSKLLQIIPLLFRGLYIQGIREKKKKKKDGKHLNSFKELSII